MVFDGWRKPERMIAGKVTCNGLYYMHLCDVGQGWELVPGIQEWPRHAIVSGTKLMYT